MAIKYVYANDWLLEQLKFSSKKVYFSQIVVISVLILFHSSCSKAQSELNSNSNSANSENKTNNAEFLNRDELTQEDLTDVSKLYRRYKSATVEEKEIFETGFYESHKEFRSGRFTIASEGFLESVMIFPTVEALFYAGESISHLDLRDQPQNERLKFKTSHFKDALKYYKAAKEFAEKSSQTEELRKFPEIEQRISCLTAFTSGKEVKPCEFIKSILKENGIS